MERVKILELINLVLDIREIRDRKREIPEMPYAAVSVSSIGTKATFYIKDTGFYKDVSGYDKMYEFSFPRECDQENYIACKAHLERLKKKAAEMEKEEHRAHENTACSAYGRGTAVCGEISS